MISRYLSIAAHARCLLFALLTLAGPGMADDSIFHMAELPVQASPDAGSRWNLAAGEQVVDFDIWPDRPVVVALVRGADGSHRVREWRIGGSDATTLLDVGADLVPASITVHPLGKKLFLGGRSAEQSVILAASAADGWQLQRIHASDKPLRRLLVSPRPFVARYDAASGQPQLSYRLVFAERQADGNYSTRSVLEQGGRDYQIIGPAARYTELDDVDVQPTRNDVASAVPAAFHPGGHILLWQDAKGCFHKLPYAGMNWGEAAPVAGKPCGGSLTVTPNGVGLLHWNKGQPGVQLITEQGRKSTPLAAQFRFAGTPSSVADGKGVVGLVDEGTGQGLVYVPVQVPLHDVVNAWMYLEGADDERRFGSDSGLFRRLPHEQLYQLYDSENYSCGGYDSTTPTRPYLVTSDIFWELIGAAYEGIFIVNESQRGMPAFWIFAETAAADLAARQPDSPWAKAFAAIVPLRDPTAVLQGESALIAAAKGKAVSLATGEEFDYGELLPRGHYASDPQRAAYFKAVHYLTELAARREDTASLRQASAATKATAQRWIATYQPFIAPSRAPLVWGDGAAVPAYARHALAAPQVFPLSWGFDNEVLLSSVYHADWPKDEQIVGADGGRLLPSGLDLAAALGSGAARALLAEEFRRYPRLEPVIDTVARRRPAKSGSGEDLYQAWLQLLATQWSDAVHTPATATFGRELWQRKRLQTGLASWATLRHATTLVNERIAAQCGEGGFEAIVLRPPRGYVEPDAEFFAASARLFEQIEKSLQGLGDIGVDDPNQLGADGQAQRDGIARRLQATAQQARLFEAMARKQLRGEALSEADYEAILLIARVAEHHLLVFKSLSNKDLALSNPDPMMKIADVAGDGPLLMAAVGRPLEWDQVVPYFGRRAIVKGSVYSYYEFSAPAPLQDAQWRKQVDKQARPPWIDALISDKGLSCPAKAPF
ncbi:uncharacterized protein DUF3160 [Tahibacter aquaticus]|uniref:Uncharacterized protein DUF3160 n=1 Tax=Tahibacter aquaticus TaxID=520092 RepID=A0A4R6YN57_9GAMM|nr:DUF3160 domain-containing protein [Tahibacter aquaticus]TDR38995.1 uncharacterized protein DUF3160 [Tahibacter aquaticus]